ncbi:hypothetical protein SeLEV6574_g03544 [Synchytrium endobioticum]|uniref:Uncharacterized protein n=1 Tax=Synchytrium endobioticum TaxID=286115 RepID=A0A507D3W0_9FUNG|nr:hypothetical protein SeLEV6574_g03544 [Synchytrium endobioticum]
MSEIVKDQARREARRAKILAGANDRLGKITGVYSNNGTSSTASTDKPSGVNSDVGAEINSNDAPQGRDNPPADHYRPIQSTATVPPSATQPTNIRNRFPHIHATRVNDPPLPQSPSVVRTPERIHASTVSRPSHIATPQGIARELADSLAGEGELHVFPDPSDILPPGVCPSNSLDANELGGFNGQGMAQVMQVMMNAIKNNNPNRNSSGSNSNNSGRQAPPTFTNDIPPIPTLQQQTAQQITRVSVRIWKLIHMTSVCILALWALYTFATSPNVSIDEDLYDTDTDMDIQSLGPWQRASIRLGALFMGGSRSAYVVHELGGMTIWTIFLTIEISLQVVWITYQSVYPDPPSTPTLWSEITSLHPTLQTLAKLVSDYHMVFTSVIEDVCTFVFILGIAVIVGGLSMPS